MKFNLKTTFETELFAENFECLNCSRERLDNIHHYLCEKCFKEVELIKHACSKCGDEVGSFDNLCNDCKEDERLFDKAICVAKYDGLAKSLVYKLKYGQKTYLAQVLASFMLDKLKESNLDNIDMIIPVPLNINRERERGYNQSQLISEIISKKCNIKLNSSLIKRVKDTPTQTHLNKDERKNNLKNAFELTDKKEVKDKNILIIDDIVTTGATINELSKLLRKYKANKIYALVFCHA